MPCQGIAQYADIIRMAMLEQDWKMKFATKGE